MDPDATMPEADDYTPEAFDENLTAEVLLPQGSKVLRVRVIGRKCDADGKEIRARTSNPILDTREYEVEFQDGSTDVFTANVIAKNLFSQVDDEGHSQVMMDEITDQNVMDRQCRRTMDSR